MRASGRILGATLLCVGTFSSSRVQAQSVSVDEVVGLYATDTIRAVTPIMFKLRYTNPDPLNFAVSNGFKIYSPDGATWDHAAVAGDTLTGAIPRSAWDINFAINVALGTGTPPADTVGFLGAKIASTGMPAGFNGVPYGVKIGAVPEANNGLHLCIDSSFFRTGGAWKWVAQGGTLRYPSWSGPHCYTIYAVPDLKPTITNAPALLSGRHCQTISYDFNAVEPDGEPYTFEKVSGPGTINSATGVWSWLPSLSFVGQAVTIEIRACEPHGCGTSVIVPITVTNEVPAFTAGCRDTTWLTLGSTTTKDMNGSDGCNDPLHFFLGPVAPAFDGTVSINSGSGLITFTSTASSPLGVYDVTVYVSDTRDSVLCHTYFRISAQCCINRRGNANGDSRDNVDISDMMAYVGYLFLGYPMPTTCWDEANFDGSPDQTVDISDLMGIVDYIFMGGSQPAPCPL